MKPFFPQSATRAKYYAIRRWILASSLLGLASILIMSFLYLPEHMMHTQLIAQHKELHSYDTKHTKPLNDPNKIQLALSKIEARQKRAGQPVALLKKIKNLCKDDSSLESFHLKRHDLQITLAAKNAPTLVTIADSLAQQSTCTGLHISSLEPKEQRMIAVLKSNQELKNS